MTDCCSCWDSDFTIEDLNIMDDIVIVCKDIIYTSRPKRFTTECIRINATTFFIHKKSLDGRVQIVITFYDSNKKPQFVRGFLYLDDNEYAIKTFDNNTISLYN
jgi:hypothetical protein